MRELTFPVDTFDQDATFPFEYLNYKNLPFVSTAYLFNSEKEGKIYIMQKNACIKAEYTEKDYQESKRMKEETPVRNGDKVVVGSNVYLVTILGNYSDAGYLVLAEGGGRVASSGMTCYA